MSTLVHPPRQVYLCLKATDMRRSFDGLAALVQEVVAHNPFEESWFVFCNRAGDRLKVLWWNGSGFCILYKRLERGTFTLPRLRDGTLELTPSQLMLLFEGMDWRRLSIPTGTKFQAAA